METVRYNGIKYHAGQKLEVKDVLVAEEMLSIALNQQPFTVTMRTPGNDKELVAGLLFTEGVYSMNDPMPEIIPVAFKNNGIPISIQVHTHESEITITIQQRSMLSVSSCGICGKTQIDSLTEGKEPFQHNDFLLPNAIDDMFRIMNERQETFQQTGGSHAAAAFSINADLLSIQEDIGRHNAVDKVVGELLYNKSLHKARCLIVSGRVSFEIVSKCHAAGIPFLAAVSAPSSLAVDVAEKLGITLMGFCRDNCFTVYTHHQFIQNKSHSVIK
ncbi:MAG: formate dehydrogenase accessory sulfurtransferase FdhD [Candidatus Competibacteraceae bacterium]|nr:formate dehydrogenase accessory sulfurtransferase FdhD [Candidatus Competibacteraceae bacterium]